MVLVLVGEERSWGYKSERVEWNRIHKRNLLFSFPILQGLHTIQPKLPCHSPFMIARLMVETNRAHCVCCWSIFMFLFHSFNWILWSPKRSELWICPLKHCKRCTYDSRPCRFHNIFLVVVVVFVVLFTSDNFFKVFFFFVVKKGCI